MKNFLIGLCIPILLYIGFDYITQPYESTYSRIEREAQLRFSLEIYHNPNSLYLSESFGGATWEGGLFNSKLIDRNVITFKDKERYERCIRFLQENIDKKVCLE